MRDGAARDAAARLCALAVALLAFAAPPALAGPVLKSGVYEHLLLAVAPDGGVFGRYRETQGEGVEKTCSFFLAGRARPDGGADVVTWNRANIPGELKALDHGVSLSAAKANEHPGCAAVLPPEVDSGLELELIDEANWIGLATAAKPKVYLRSKPDAAERSRTYVVARDALGVISRTPGWLYADYRDGEKSVKGWVQADDVTEVKAP